MNLKEIEREACHCERLQEVYAMRSNLLGFMRLPRRSQGSLLAMTCPSVIRGLSKLLLYLFVPLILTQCGVIKKVAGGSTSETENTISGVIKDSTGNTVADARVLLLTADHNPYKEAILPKRSAYRRVFTDSKGRFLFDAVSAGAYTIQAGHPDNKTITLIQELELEEGKNIDTLEGLLQEPGSITISLLEMEVLEADYFYISGTTIFTEIDDAALEAGAVILENIPPAVYSAIQLVKNGNTPGTSILYEDIEVLPGENKVIGPYAAWQYSVRVYINTSSTGADVIEDLVDFPLLVRLDGSSSPSPFDQAQGDGIDIRFAKSDDFTPLAYEIERWDPAAGGTGAAEVWVKMDTVHGNNDLQFIYMYTGKSDAPDKSDRAAVFDSGNGFAGVWHLHDDFEDATANGNNGTNYGSTDIAGVIADGQDFNGADSIRIQGIMGSPADISISGWANLDAADSNGAEIISVGDYVGIRLDAGEGTFGYFYPPESEWINIISNEYFAGTGWHHFTFTFNDAGDSQVLYIDGVEALRADYTDPINYSGLEPYTFIGIGRSALPETDFEFDGIIDEVRISGTVRSADWIKMCYENQKENSTVVRIE
jgi:hypothetical protein